MKPELVISYPDGEGTKEYHITPGSVNGVFLPFCVLWKKNGRFYTQNPTAGASGETVTPEQVQEIGKRYQLVLLNLQG